MSQRNPNLITSLDEPNLIKKLLARNQFTPDFSSMRFYKKIPVFVYGNEKRDGLYHGHLLGAEYLGRAITCSNCFSLKERSSEAIAFHEDNLNTTRAKVKGELYNVSIGGLMILDIFHLNRSMKYRQPVNLQLLDQEPDFCKYFGGLATTQGLMWLGIKDKHKDFNMISKGVTRYPHDEQLKGFPFFDHVIHRRSEWDMGIRRGIDRDEEDQGWLDYRNAYGMVH